MAFSTGVGVISPSSLRELAVGRLLFPLTNHFLNRKGVLARAAALQKSEYYPQDQLKEMQERALRRVVAYASESIPFYRRRFKEAGLAAAEIRSREDIRHIPPLTRQEVIEHHLEMVPEHCQRYARQACGRPGNPGRPVYLSPWRRNRVVRNTSSGSTGAPTVFFEDGSRTAFNWACEVRYKSWFGVGIGAREARFSRLSPPGARRAASPLFRRLLWNQLVLPGVNLTEEDLAISHRQLSDFCPRVLWGFTSALTALARYVEDHGLHPLRYRPELVITWAAPLYEHEEVLLRRVFQCEVTNIYGAREVGHIAAKCPQGAYHINQESLYVETEPTEDAAGEMLVTTLDCGIMPFLRYRMGDLGAVSEGACRCGRTLQQFTSLLGRTGEVFTTKDGRLISPNFWCRTFMDPRLGGKVLRFQVVYKTSERMLVRIVKGRGYNGETERVLTEALEKSFPSSLQFGFSYVDEIKPEVSGKYQMVINETGVQGSACASGNRH